MPPIFPRKNKPPAGSPTPGAMEPAAPVSAPAAPARKGAVKWKPTVDEQVELEDLALSLVSSGLLLSQIKKQFKKWAEKKEKEIRRGNPALTIDMDARTVTRYVSRARARIRLESGKNKDELREDSLAFYLAIARDVTADPRSRLLARERIDRLFGLDMPIKVAPTTPDGEQSFGNLSDTDLNARIAARIAEIAGQAGAGAIAADAGGAPAPRADAAGGAEDRTG